MKEKDLEESKNTCCVIVNENAFHLYDMQGKCRKMNVAHSNHINFLDGLHLLFPQLIKHSTHITAHYKPKVKAKSSSKQLFILMNITIIYTLQGKRSINFS